MSPSPYTLPDFGKPPFAGSPEARFEPLPADGVLPEGFFSTSNLPTYVHVGRPLARAAAAAHGLRDREAGGRPGDHRAAPPAARASWWRWARPRTAAKGIVVHAQGFLGGAHGANEFRFMSTEVSRERPVNYEELAARVGEEKRARRLPGVGRRARAGALARAARTSSGSSGTATCRRCWRGTRSPCTTSRRRSSAPRWA